MFFQRRKGGGGAGIDSALRAFAFESREQHQVVGHYCRPDVGLEVVEPAPDATCETVAALEAGDAGLDPGAESGYRDPSHPDNARGSVARQITRAMGLS